MALIHDVIDSDVRFIIDPITRTISNQESKKLVLTRGDHNSERFTFEIPRYVEGHDMSLCNVVRIHFINTDSKTREEMADIYEPDDASLLDTNDQLFTFSWLISRTATNFAGPLAFAIEFQCVIDGTVVYSWRTAANSTITIVNGINNAKSNDVEVDEPPTDIYSTIRVATVASMIHDIIDSDVRFIVDPVTRSISNQDSNKLMLIRGDHKSERFTFEIPRFIEGHDMSLCNVVRIHYINTNSKTRSVITDIYEPTDMSAQPEDIVTFSWLIGRSATTFAGTLAFSIEFQCVIDNVIEYSWHTGVNNTIVISDGISNTEVLNEEYSDILTIWWERLYATSELPIEIITQEMFEELGKSVRDNTLYILEDDPTLDEIEKVIEDTKAFDERLTEHLKKYEALDKNMVEHLEKYTELYKNVADHFEDFESLLDEIKKLEKRITDLENGTGGCKHVWGYIQQGSDLWDRQCTKCGKIEYNVEFLCTDGTEHTWVKLDVTKATCTTTAVQRYYCEKCDVVRNGEVIQNALGHKWSYYEDSTAELTGWSRVCTVCETVEKNVNYVCTGGNKHAWIYYTDVNAEEYGWSRTCSVCKITEIDVECECIINGQGFGPHNLTVTNVTIPTCTEASYNTLTCLRCGYSYEKLNREPYGHDFVNDICTVCGTAKSQAECTHNWVYTQEGLELWDRRCTKCGRIEYDVEPPCTDGTEHAWNKFDVTTATCTSPSLQRYKCDKCGTVRTGEVVQSKKPHTWSYYEDSKSELTGYSRTCIVCDLVEFNVENGCIDGNDHALGEPIYDAEGYYAPTCEEDGYAGYVCSKCGSEISKVVPALKHTLVFSTSVEPTCVADGYVRFVCSRCNNYQEDEVIRATGEHTKGIPIYDVIGAYEPTCGVSGYAAFSCTKCNTEFWDTVPATGEHTFGEPIYDGEGYYEPTCTTPGYAGYVCSKCGGEESGTVPALQHDYDDVVTPPTCTTQGYTTKECIREGCDYSYIPTNSYVPALNHPTLSGPTSDSVASTCTTLGYDVYVCTVCDEEVIQHHTSYASHTETLDTVNSVTKTCDTDGVNVYKCSVCGTELRRETVIKGHENKTTTVEPTCTTSGSTITRCTVCGEETTEYLPPKPHSPGSIDHTVYPTCIAKGYHYRNCTVCKQVYQADELPAVGHSYVDTITTPTCTTQGYTTKTCSKCNHSYIDPDSYVDALGHDYEVQEIDPDNRYDDVSSDGYVDVCTRCGHRDYSDHT